ncbi:MAG TPA: BON domain-containing protein [Steroidobacteraceae bacterium]|nr:BON domain-containing protein [Steroidobacteraceae bacterium]
MRIAAGWSCTLLLAVSVAACTIAGPASDRDAAITARLQAQLLRYTDLQAPNQVDVQTRNGVVYLHGLVDTPYQRELAASVARQVPGVVRVENLIGVTNDSQ